jgi:hypothetical protein
LDLSSVVLWETGKAKYCEGFKLTRHSNSCPPYVFRNGGGEREGQKARKGEKYS